MGKDLKVLLVSPEVAPFTKSGGLGDVAGSLPKELLKLGVDIRVVLPKYRGIKEELLRDMKYAASLDIVLGWRKQGASVLYTETPVPHYLIENDYYFARDGYYGYGDDYERFAFFCKAAIETMAKMDFQPDVVHFNDWQTGPACVYLKDIYGKYLFYSGMKSLFTIHNLQYQGIFGHEVLGTIDLNDGYFADDKLEFHSNISFMKAGLTYADHISTVSSTYASEIQTPGCSYGLNGILSARGHQLTGIVNGIDYDDYNPRTDKRLFNPYDANDMAGKAVNKAELQKLLHLPVRDDVPMLAVVSRLVDQKGLDLISQLMDNLLNRDVQLVILGTGDGRYEHLFGHTAWLNPDKMSASITFNDELARRIYAASDFFIMPSMFEPCGLGQMIAMRYGSLPIVRKTGGLADTVTHFDPVSGTGNGFVFEDYLASGLLWAIDSALSVYYRKDELRKAVDNAMGAECSWQKSAKRYISLYENLRG